MTVVLIGCAGLSTEPVSRLLTRCRVRQTLRQRLCRDDGCIAAPVGGVIVMIVARRGNAVVEFALAGTMMLTFVAGMINVGFGIYESMQVQHAAAVGAQYAAKHGWDQAGITAAVIGAASISGVAASPAPIQFCG